MMKSFYYNLPDPPVFELQHNDLPCDSGAVMVTRHSIRPPMLAGQFGVPLELTEKGILAARKLGKNWAKLICRVSTSSSLRCVQTGNEIVRGAGLSLSTLHNPELGEPGAFIFDSDQAFDELKQLGPLETVNVLLKGEPLRGHRGAEEGVYLMLQSFFRDMPNEGTIHVEVTHDTILAVLIYFLLGIDTIEETEWPRMMEGALFWKKEKKIYWYWRGETFSREMSVG